MIVRIATEGQFRVDDSNRDKLNELDNAAVEAVEAGDGERFHQILDELVSLVRDSGQELGDDELEPSDVILPPSDVTLEEARQEFNGDGLIPD